jgi:hypothetical protein
VENRDAGPFDVFPPRPPVADPRRLHEPAAEPPNRCFVPSRRARCVWFQSEPIVVAPARRHADEERRAR